MKLTYYHNSFDQNLFIQEYNNGTLLHLVEIYMNKYIIPKIEHL